MIFIEEVIQIHDASIKEFGGSYGIRDIESLESALIRPFQTFGGQYLYQDVFEKAAAIIESLIVNHPFVDGNKRTGFAICGLFLENCGYEFSIEQELITNFVIAIASGEVHFEEIVTWLRNNTNSIKK